jgi:hypothetical protein
MSLNKSSGKYHDVTFIDNHITGVEIIVARFLIIVAIGNPPPLCPISAKLLLRRGAVEGLLKKNEHRKSNIQHRMLNGKR